MSVPKQWTNQKTPEVEQVHSNQLAWQFLITTCFLKKSILLFVFFLLFPLLHHISETRLKNFLLSVLCLKKKNYKNIPVYLNAKTRSVWILLWCFFTTLLSTKNENVSFLAIAFGLEKHIWKRVSKCTFFGKQYHCCLLVKYKNANLWKW